MKCEHDAPSLYSPLPEITLTAMTFFFLPTEMFLWKKPSHQNITSGDQSLNFSAEKTASACSTATTPQLHRMFPHLRNTQLQCWCYIHPRTPDFGGSFILLLGSEKLPFLHLNSFPQTFYADIKLPINFNQVIHWRIPWLWPIIVFPRSFVELWLLSNLQGCILM